MSHSPAIARPAPADALATATEITAQAARAPRRCGVALLASAGPSFTLEIPCLLRRRLAIAALITGLGFAAFFLRHLLSGPIGFSTRPIDVALLGVAAAFHIGMAALLATRLPLSLFQLRSIEVLLFGLTGAYFAWLQIHVLHRETVLEWAAAGHQADVLRLANFTNILRWFVLIVTYGTFVPNTWRRCALLVGVLMLAPLVITTVMLVGCPFLGDRLGPSLLDTLLLLSIASAIAIFGSYKISVLSREALEARQLGQYRLKRRLGAGGMGEVYLGEHVLLRRACAIKLIRPDQAGDSTALQRFEREVQSMANLTHWNTVEVYDYGHADDGTFYYVMEYLPGLSLQELVSRHGPLPPARAVHFLRQVCAGLREAHGDGLIHRDIKPSNVIACERGGVQDVAKLLDFGLVQCMDVAKTDSKLTVQGTILGSPAYMSPEQAQGKEHLDARTDIYSLGAVAYFLLTDQVPFVRETAMQMLMAHVYEQVVAPSRLRPEIPADLEAVILRCLEKDPGRRYQNAEELEEALSACACAADWGRREAAAWWQQAEGRTEEPTADGLALPTQGPGLDGLPSAVRA